VLLLYLLAYFPGLFSEDSYILWRQITGGAGGQAPAAGAAWYMAVLERPFNAFLPLANTIICWLVTRPWRSPAAIGFLQAGALGSAFTAGMLLLEARGLGRWARFAILAAFLAFPLHGLYAVTLWKDVLFSAALLWLTVLLAQTAPSQGAEQPAFPKPVALVLATAAVWLGRPNGPAPAVLTFAALFVVHRGAWRRIAASAVAMLAIVFLVEVPLSIAVGKNHDGENFYRSSPFICDIGAVLSAQGAIDERERAVLGQLDDLDEWRDLYDPRSFTYWRTKRAHWASLDVPGMHEQFLRTWFSVARHNLRIVLAHRVRIATIGWRLGLAPGATYVIPADRVDGRYVPHRPEPAEIGQRRQWESGALNRWATNFVNATVFSNRWDWLFAQPATWMYLTLLLAAVCAVRGRSMRVWIVFVPVVSNWLAAMAFCVAQDVRYFYPGCLVAPFAAGLALLPGKRVAPAPKVT